VTRRGGGWGAGVEGVRRELERALRGAHGRAAALNRATAAQTDGPAMFMRAATRAALDPRPIIVGDRSQQSWHQRAGHADGQDGRASSLRAMGADFAKSRLLPFSESESVPGPRRCKSQRVVRLGLAWVCWGGG